MSSKSRGITRGATAIITGASTGIGRALAVKLARRKACRMVLSARSEAVLEATAKAVREAGGEAHCVVGDVADESVIESLAKTCLDKFGGVDLLVNNAGLAKTGPMQRLNVDDWRYVFEVNFFAPLKLVYELMPHFMEKGAGKVVNVASVAGKIAFPGSVCYCASKFALTGFSEGMAAELSWRGIDVVTVCPGWVRTEFFKKNSSSEDPSEIALHKDLQGWIMRNVLSISSEECAEKIIRACEKGGCHEIILTKPGVVLERMSGLAPNLAFRLARYVPANRGPKPQDRTVVP
jgi:short-subunit dehydrogenase